jgi:threonine dehydrogenase-like Zn-dependent dehydrogenase
MLGTVNALATFASSAFDGVAQLLVVSPNALVALSAAALVGVLVLAAVRRAERAVVVVRSRTDLRIRTTRQQAATPVLVPQTDPDAAGRPRPRAPSGRSRTR